MSYPRFLWTYRTAIRMSVWRLACIIVFCVLYRPKPQQDAVSLFPRDWDHR